MPSSLPVSLPIPSAVSRSPDLKTLCSIRKQNTRSGLEGPPLTTAVKVLSSSGAVWVAARKNQLTCDSEKLRFPDLGFVVASNGVEDTPVPAHSIRCRAVQISTPGSSSKLVFPSRMMKPESKKLTLTSTTATGFCWSRLGCPMVRLAGPVWSSFRTFPLDPLPDCRVTSAHIPETAAPAVAAYRRS